MFNNYAQLAEEELARAEDAGPSYNKYNLRRAQVYATLAAAPPPPEVVQEAEGARRRAIEMEQETARAKARFEEAMAQAKKSNERWEARLARVIRFGDEINPEHRENFVTPELVTSLINELYRLQDAQAAKVENTGN